jgi:predicted DNA-binding transcriptional regulator AlpA
MRLLVFEDLELEKGIPYSAQWINRLVKEKRFPAPFKMGPGNNGTNFWREDVIDAHIEALAAAANQKVEAA